MVHSMLQTLTAAFLAGLVGSPHCIGMCGSFALACGGRVSQSAAWHTGKLLSYAFLGALAGWAGDVVPGPAWVAPVVSGALIIWFAAALAGLVPEPTLHVPGLKTLATRAAARGDVASRFVFGIANGFLPCGLVYAALAISVASGSAFVGALAMVAFGLGTAPALAAVTFGLRRAVARDLRLRRALAVLVLLAGLWVVGRRFGTTPASGHGMQAPAPEATHQEPPSSGS